MIDLADVQPTHKILAAVNQPLAHGETYEARCVSLFRHALNLATAFDMLDKLGEAMAERDAREASSQAGGSVAGVSPTTN